MIEADLVARLEADAALIALLGGPRLYPVEAPGDSTPPYLVYRREDTSPDDTLDDSKSVHTIPIAIEAHASTYRAALALGAALKSALDGWRADPPATLMSCTYQGEHDGAGAFDDADRKRRSFCRELVFIALTRA